MEETPFLSLLPDICAVAELFPGCALSVRDSEQTYQGIRVYRSALELRSDTLYLIRATDSFPRDRYAWISPQPQEGSANHIICPDLGREEILDRVLEALAQMRSEEIALDRLIYGGGSVQELCEAGAQILGNPVYIHDDWFMMVAQSAQVDQILTPEYVMTSTKGFLPRVIIDDFRDDSDYLETYVFRTAQIWSTGNDVPDCLYVNLWDGNIYRGRLLVIESNHPFRHSDFLFAQVLTQRAIYLLNRKQLHEHQQSRSMDDIMFSLLQGNQPDPGDLVQLMNMLNWNQSDKLLCIRIQSQQPDNNAIEAHVLHSDLFRAFPKDYVMFLENQQTIILNLSREIRAIQSIRHTLSPLCRDYCLYAGLSSPVLGIRDLHLAYFQSEVALSQAFRMRNEKWIVSFPECALDYILTHLDSPLQPWHLTSPDLHVLLDHDKEKGTPYYETLRTYLLQERDIPRTAEALIIHRTTLLYRLKKIRSMISANLEDPWHRLYLLLSIRILEAEVPTE